MPRTFKELYLELTNSIPKLPLHLAQLYVNRAWKDIRDSRHWGFLQAEGILFTPAEITTGTFSITQFSNLITANAAAIAALTGLTNPVLTKRQIRFSNGPIYNISVIDASFASNGRLYLDRPYKESTNTAATYSIYRCYYGAPETTSVAADGTATTIETTDFLRYNSIYDTVSSRHFTGLHLSREILARRDPQRTTFNNPIALFSYKSDSSGNPQFEMWPHNKSARAYICSYQRKGIDLTALETLPSIIPDELLIERALFYGCEWAAKNQSRYTELRGINWRLEMAAHKATYSNISSRDPGLLEIAHRNDEEAFPQSEIITNRSYRQFGDDDLMSYANIDYS